MAPVPFSMEGLARVTFGLRPVPAMKRLAPIPIKLVWDRSRERDPAQAFLRRELAGAVKRAVRVD